MNEAAGIDGDADSSGNGLNGIIDPTGVQTGATFDGATGYNWVRRPPEPSRRRRAGAHHPGAGQHRTSSRATPRRSRSRSATAPRRSSATSSRRARPRRAAASGRSRTRRASRRACSRARSARSATGAKTAINDNQWHILTCVLTSTARDDVRRRRRAQPPERRRRARSTTAIPMTVGGKIDCDQIEVTCDYFSGQIDYVKITKSVQRDADRVVHRLVRRASRAASTPRPRTTPTAGSPAYAWASVTAGRRPRPTRATGTPAAGTYNATLTVTDNQGGDQHVHRSRSRSTPATRPARWPSSGPRCGCPRPRRRS